MSTSHMGYTKRILGILLTESFPEPWSFGRIEARFVGVTQADTIGLVFQVSPVHVRHRRAGQADGK